MKKDSVSLLLPVREGLAPDDVNLVTFVTFTETLLTKAKAWVTQFSFIEFADVVPL